MQKTVFPMEHAGEGSLEFDWTDSVENFKLIPNFEVLFCDSEPI